MLAGGCHDHRETNGTRMPALGHLGGQSVSIPYVYANLLEYDGDPHFMTPRNGPAPPRTAQSGIRSFGFEIGAAKLVSRYGPQAAGQSALDTPRGRDLFIGINANSHYSGDEQVVALAGSTASRLGQPYSRQDEDVYGLEVYAPMSAILAKSPRLIDRNADIYLYRRPDGTADAYINCHRPAGKVCRLRYSLAPALKASVSLKFPRYLLPQWATLQSSASASASAMILGFRRTI